MVVSSKGTSDVWKDTSLKARDMVQKALLKRFQHQQEQVNPFCYCESFEVEMAVDEKVYVIDSPGEGIVAMLSNEY